MPEALVLAPTPDPRVFLTSDGRKVSPPADWACLPPGDAMITRRVKLAGPSWAVVEKKGRKVFSKGLWAPRVTIETVTASANAERGTEAYAKKRAAGTERREKAEAVYAESFEDAVVRYLAFSREWAKLGEAMGKLVATHATPVGSGTVARTKRIPIEERAAAAVIAWMRHQTTAYDDMTIARIKGERRKVRRELAAISKRVLDMHRRDVPHGIDACPLCRAIVSAVKV
jgi:hypothetical protein